MFNRKQVLTACGAAILGLVMVASSEAWVNSSGTTQLRFSRSVALPGVILQAGAYTFESAAAGSGLDLVRVLSSDRSNVYFMAFTMRIERPAGLPANRVVTFGEVPAGNPQPIEAWYPPDSPTGHQFIYRYSH